MEINFENVRDIIVNTLSCEADQITPETNLYEDLEADGFITTMPGRGSFVAPQNPALHREESLKQMEEHLQHAIDAARRGGITKDEVSETLDLLWEES